LDGSVDVDFGPYAKDQLYIRSTKFEIWHPTSLPNTTEGDFDVAKVLARSLGPREDLHQFGSEVWRAMHGFWQILKSFPQSWPLDLKISK
jgi:hypothetical protein